MNGELRILLVEDSPGDARLIQELLRDASEPVSVTHVDRLDDAVEKLQSLPFDVAVVDLSLPDSSGMETFAQVQANAPMVPVVVLTGLSDEGLGMETVQQGAQDYLSKGQVTPQVLLRTLRYSVERKRTLLALESNQARFRTLLEAVPQAIVIDNGDGEIVLVNSRAQARFGYSAKELVGQSIETLVAPESLQAFREGRVRFLDDPGKAAHRLCAVAAVTKAGVRFPAEVGHSIVDTTEGVRVISVIDDVTAHFEMLARLERSRREELETKDQFISHVSHELRSPLTAIYLHVEGFLQGFLGEVHTDLRSGLEVIARNTAQLSTMIEDLIEATKARGGKLTVTPEHLALVAVVEECIERISRSAALSDIELELSAAQDAADVWGDRDRILQILTNLLENAVKFSPQGSRVLIETKTDEVDRSMIRVSVADQGIGIASADIDRVFEELYQGETALHLTRQGLGLGLFICEQLVAGHGGKIWVESEVGTGSTFHFTLPRNEPSVPTEAIGLSAEVSVPTPVGSA